MSLKVKFLGALGTCTGSCSLLQYARTDSSYLVDCGMYQGIIGAQERNLRPFKFDPKRISAVFLTHAHMDHCGLLPRLVEEGFDGEVICTRVTAEIARNALLDASNLEDWISPSSVNAIKFRCPDDKDDFQLGHFYPLSTDLFFAFLRTSHIIGSVAIELRHNLTEDKQINILFSGDVGPSTDGEESGGLVKPRQYPNPNTAFIVSESTYGNKSRDPQSISYKARIEALGQTLQEGLSVSPNATVIFPCFSLQRTQDLLLDLHYLFSEDCERNGLHSLKPTVYVDSPLAEKHTEAMKNEFPRVNRKGKSNFLNNKHPAFAGMSDKEILQLLMYVMGGESSLDLPSISALSRPLWMPPPEHEEHGPTLIISASGMCGGGRVVDHLKRHLKSPSATIALTGYQSPGTPGAELLKLADTSEEKRSDINFKLGDMEVNGKDVQARIINLAAFFSGHADQKELIDFILRKDSKGSYEPVTVFLNHGDNIARKTLKQKLIDRASTLPNENRPLRDVYTPNLDDLWFDFENGEWLKDDSNPDGESEIAEMMSLMREIRDSNLQIINLLQELLNTRED